MNPSLPLYSLTIAQFTDLVNGLINEAIKSNPHIQPASPQEENNEMDIEGLTKFLKCCKVTVHSYKKLGLPYYKVGRKLLFDKKEVLKFMQVIDKSKAKRR